MVVAALLELTLALLGGTSVEAEVARMTPREKAAAVVVSGLPAPPGVRNVFVTRSTRHLPRPRGALVFVDQEGGAVRGFAELPPARPASAYATAAEARAAGRDTGRALRRAGVRVDLAPVLDTPDGPLGSRHFRTQAFGVAFARGLADAGVAACVKHFPGLGSTAVSTDDRPRVDGVVRPHELAGFRAAVRAGAPCVMTSHAFYRTLGSLRASLEPATYRLIRSTGFAGVTITDSLNVVSRPPAYWPTRAARAGADLLLYTHPDHAARAVDALVPLARRGELDEAVARVLRFRREYGAR
ncbi:MAG TPA: glycoside hydrolase family 3 N-terminal domain-containing protein [Gaiellaceae bacterium]|nr:glycoside hydrolase family 3 N-terminal domain-containing protein [Gaiellaceae bacterium]